MILLLDTQLLLWAASDTKKLSVSARRMLEDAKSQLWFSAASLWEIAIKNQLGRDDFNIEPRQLRTGLIKSGWQELSVTSEHAIATATLPFHHRDPFDRMLIAQAQVEGMTLLTSDSAVARYQGNIRKL